jgi:hypothetical protein
MQNVRKGADMPPGLAETGLAGIAPGFGEDLVLRQLAVAALAIEFMLNLLDEPRRKRRSRRTKRRAAWRAWELFSGDAPDLKEARLDLGVDPTPKRPGWRSFLRRLQR